MSTVARDRRRRRAGDRRSSLLLYGILLLFFLPSLWIVLTSLRQNVEVNARPPVWIPRELTLESYAILLGAPTPEGAFGMGGSVPFGSYARNSIVVATASTLLAMVFGTMAGYAFARFRFRWKNGVFLGLLLARAVPGIALSLPLFLVFVRLRLVDQLGGLIVVYAALNIPFTAWLMDSFFRTIPEELAEAAMIDGSTRWGSFLRIELPLTLPGVAASAIFAFLTAWNEYALASVITRTTQSRTFPPGLFELTGQFVSDWRGMCAMATMMLLPAVVFVALVQRQLMAGLTAGAVKG